MVRLMNCIVKQSDFKVEDSGFRMLSSKKKRKEKEKKPIVNFSNSWKLFSVIEIMNIIYIYFVTPVFIV